jgi:gluconate 2-dehydrogenase gamma chain
MLRITETVRSRASHNPVPAMSEPTRREFVTSTAAMFGGGWLWLQLPALASLSACARDAAVRNEPFTTFTEDEGRAMRAFAARIIPSGDGLPGAEEAGAAWFADGALAGPMAPLRELITGGLADLDQRARAAHGVAFADAEPDAQDALLREVEDTQFFFLARLLAVAGTFSDPSLGGNRDHAGFTLLQMEHAPAYQPPFGWYDAQHVAQNGGGQS